MSARLLVSCLLTTVWLGATIPNLVNKGYIVCCFGFALRAKQNAMPNFAEIHGCMLGMSYFTFYMHNRITYLHLPSPLSANDLR
jgi:hypothetical protein